MLMLMLVLVLMMKMTTTTTTTTTMMMMMMMMMIIIIIIIIIIHTIMFTILESQRHGTSIPLSTHPHVPTSRQHSWRACCLPLPR